MDHYYIMRDYAMAPIPWAIRVLIGQLAHRGHKAMLYGQGTLRLSDDEIRASKHEIWASINGVLAGVRAAAGAEKARPFWFLGGEQPTEVDTAVFGFIVSVLLCTA